MARVKRIWIVVCFLFVEFLTGSEASRGRRQAAADTQDPSSSLQGLGSLLGQLPSQGLTGMDLTSLMDSLAQGATGAGQGGVDLTSLMDSLAQGATGAGQGGVDLTSLMDSLAQGATGAGQGGVDLTSLMDSLAQSAGQGGVDLSSVQEMAEALQQQQSQGEGGRSFATGEAGGGLVQVHVETKTLDDLLASEGGRRQLGQLNAQLEQALDSLADSGVHVMQAQQGVDRLEVTLTDILTMLASGGGGLQGLGSNETAAMMSQLLQSVEQLPAVKGVVEGLYRVLAGLDSAQPSSLALSLQRLLALAASSLQGSVQGMDSVLDTALASLRDNLQLLDSLLDPASLLQHANTTRCLLTSLASPEPDRGLALQCLTQLLLQASPGDSEQMLGVLNAFLNDVLNDPRALQSFLQAPSLDSAMAVVQSLVGQLDGAGLDLTTALQSVQTMLTSVTQNPQLLKALTEVLESGQLYGQLLELLTGATQGSPLTQQLVVVVNDTLVTLWTSGDLGQALDTLRHVTALLSDPAHPWSPAQQAFLDLLHRLADTLLLRLSTPAPTAPVTSIPTTTTTTTTIAPTTTVGRDTTPGPERTSTTATTTTTTAPPATPPTPSATTPPPAPATTRRDTVEDEGDNSGTHVSCSVLSLLLALLLAGWLS